MRVGPPGLAICRAVIAVAALYALALQAILGGAMSAGITGQVGAICLQNAGAPEEGPAKTPPGQAHLVCCTAAHVTPSVVVPVFASTVIVWPFRRVVRIAWRPEVVTVPRAPPGAVASARAPPVV